jgi:elongation of very long chain fatty acids protein 4
MHIMQVALNCWFVGVFAQEVSGHGMAKDMTFWGNRYDPTMSGFRVGFAIWVHYNNKYVELLDTAWMLLRKKERQVCFWSCMDAISVFFCCGIFVHANVDSLM